MMKSLRHLPTIVSYSRCLRSPCSAYVPRYYSANVALPPDIDKSEIQAKLENKEITLIDVRQPRELAEVGRIPESKNIVLEALGPIILFNEEKFAKRFGFAKPALDDPLVVYCLAGIRARTAQLALMGYGYKNVRVYVGSFEDWVEKGGPVEFPEPSS